MERQLCHERVLQRIHSGEDRIGAAVFGVDGADGDAGAAGGGTAVPGFAAAAIAAVESFHIARIAVEGIFFGGGGGAFAGGGTHRVRGWILCSGPTFWSVGAPGNQLSGFGEYAVSVAFRGSDRLAGFDERRVYVSTVCDSIFQARNRVAMDRGGVAGVYVGLSAQQLSAEAPLHPPNPNPTSRRHPPLTV